MAKEVDYICKSLEYNLDVFKAIFEGVEEEQWKWKPMEDKWCLLEVICHLIDEEKKDFRFRTKWCLEHPGEQPPAIDPVAWVKDRDYINQIPQEKIQEWISERKDSVNWLKSLRDVNWHNSYEHVKLGNLSAYFFLTNWLAHDHLHLRQITKLKLDYLQHKSGLDTYYAGNW